MSKRLARLAEDKVNSENGGKTMTTKWNGGRPKNPKRASSRQRYRQNLTQGAGGWNIGRLEPEEDKNYLINNATFGSGNMNLNDTYGEAEISKAYDLAKQIRVGTVPKSPKRQMLYFVRDMVHFYRSNGFHRLADTMAKDIQFFDVNEIFEYVSINLENIFPELETPPSTDVVLPADKVGLYCNLLEQDGWDEKNPDKKGAEAMYILSNLVDDPEDERYCRIFGVDVVYRPVSTDTLADTKPLEVGTVDSIKGTITPYDDTIEKHKPLLIQMAQFACAFLQTINTPRFVVQRQQKIHPFHKAKIKKMLGKFTPDSWNLVQWNVGEPVKSKDEETKSGGKQALHFRRGHPRKAEEHWDKVYWSTVRNRWEQYIHGYEAGHPRFGIKKSYHLPRKEV
jgi:hypothetical protein